MINISEELKRRAFVIWLRTGKMPSIQNNRPIEHKFNPWHDPENGRFTFAGTGRYYGPVNDGGSFGGGGASGTWTRPEPTHRPAPPQKLPTLGEHLDRPVKRPLSPAQPVRAPAPSAPLRTEVRNGYTYEIDSRDRTVRVSGALTVAAQPTRSRTTQARAGGQRRTPVQRRWRTLYSRAVQWPHRRIQSFRAGCQFQSRPLSGTGGSVGESQASREESHGEDRALLYSVVHPSIDDRRMVQDRRP